jgi:hypothetical protein
MIIMRSKLSNQTLTILKNIIIKLAIWDLYIRLSIAKKTVISDSLRILLENLNPPIPNSYRKYQLIRKFLILKNN